MNFLAAFLMGVAAGVTPKQSRCDYIPTYVEQEIAELLAEDDRISIGAYLLESRGLVAVQLTGEEARLH